MKVKVFANLFILAGLVLFSACNNKNQTIDWPHYMGSPTSDHYTTVTGFTKENVKNLTVSWIYDGKQASPENRSQIQCNPIVIDGILYGTTATLKLIALNAETGELKWEYDHHNSDWSRWGLGTNRGIALWQNESKSQKRIYYTVGNFLLAIDAETGTLIDSFGTNGKVDLREGLDRELGDRFILSNSPGVIYKNTLILGSRVDEASHAAPGHIRGFNVITGEREWIFHTIPHPDEPGYETWPEDAWTRIGGANAWSGMSLDIERGAVYVPTGSASYDFYGGDRIGQNLYANCILSLNAATGELNWYFQTVHHDLWDRDLPTPPVLSTVTKDGISIDVVIQTTKMGHVYVLDRDTGNPVFPVEERKVPESDLKGEQTWPTQPFPSTMPFFARQQFKFEDLSNIPGSDHELLIKQYNSLRHDQPYRPPSSQGTLIFPGYDGGGEWGGAAYHSASQTLFVNANEMPWALTMLPVYASDPGRGESGKGLFLSNCANCHGMDRKGSEFMGNIPSLLNISKKYNSDSLTQILNKGRGLMPSFNWLSKEQIHEIITYISNDNEVDLEESKKDSIIGYMSTGYIKFKDSQGYPAIKPPWGTLTAIDLANATLKWQIPFGDHPELAKKGISNTGTENYGGPVITENGLLFIAATQDEKFRVIDQENGEVLFEYQLPAGGYATPSVYSIKGKPFVVIACGGGKLGTKSADQYVAFSIE